MLFSSVLAPPKISEAVITRNLILDEISGKAGERIAPGVAGMRKVKKSKGEYNKASISFKRTLLEIAAMFYLENDAFTYRSSMGIMAEN